MGEDTPHSTLPALEPLRLCHGRRQLSALNSSKLGRPLLGGQPTRISVALWAQLGFPCPSRLAEGAWIPLSKHRGMMWLFDLGTVGARADPRSHEVRGCVMVACA